MAPHQHYEPRQCQTAPAMGLNKHRGQEAAGWARHRQGVCSGTSSVHAGEGRKEKDALLTEITWSSDAGERRQKAHISYFSRFLIFFFFCSFHSAGCETPEGWLKAVSGDGEGVGCRGEGRVGV